MSGNIAIGEYTPTPALQITEEELQIASVLSDKRTLLNSAGFMLNDVYYSALNSTVSLVEASWNYGRTNFSLQSLQFGSTSQIFIPNNSLLSDVYLVLELGNLPANSALPRGWGLAAINQIAFLMGSSNVPLLTTPFQSLFQWLMNQIETAEKREEMLALMGEEQLNGMPAGVTSLFAYIPLILPFAKYGGRENKLPFDTSTLVSPINLQITLNNANQFIGGSGVMPTAFLSGRIFLKQADFANKNMSIAGALMADHSKIYNYPFIHAQPFYPQIFVADNSTSPVQTVTLQSFINSDLAAISFGVVKSSNLTSNGGLPINPLYYERVYNVALVYNGINMFIAPGELYRLYNMSGQFGSQAIRGSQIAVAGPPYTSSPVDTYAVEVDFSRIRSLQYENHYDNTLRVANQVMNLSFQLPDTSASGNGSYIVFCTYYYNGSIACSAGQTRIYFD